MANAPSPNDLTRQQLDELDALLQRMLALPQAKPADAPAAPTPLPLPDPVPTPGPAAETAAPVAWRTDRPTGPPPRAPHLTAATAAQPEPADVLEALAGVPRANPFAYAPPVEPAPVYPAVSPVAFAPAVPPSPVVPFEPPAEPVVRGRLFGPPTPDTGVPPPDMAPTAFDPVPLAPPEPVAVASVPDFGPLELQELKAAEPVAEPSAAPAATDLPAGGPWVPVLLWPMFAVNWLLEKVLGLFGPPGLALTSPGMKHLLGWVGVILLVAAGVWTARGLGWIQFPMPVP